MVRRLVHRVLRAAALVATCATVPLMAAGPALLQATGELALPGVRGRIDHLAFDAARHRLVVAALGNDTVELVDVATGKRSSLPGAAEPQGVLHVPGIDRIVVANGSGDRVDVVDGASLATVRRIDGLPDADNVRWDAQGGQAVVGFGKGALRWLDPATGATSREVALPGHPESFQLEQRGPRVFVNVPAAGAVIVVDRAAGRVVGRWETTGAAANYPMALDEAARRLFVAARSPPSLLVFDTDSGRRVATVPIGSDADDVFVDAERHRLYVICGEGRVDVVAQASPDRYVVEGQVETAARARTGLWVADARALYVAAPAAGGHAARILVFKAP